MRIFSKMLLILCSMLFYSNLVKAQQPAITLSADPIAFGGSWIPVKVSIPQSKVSSSPTTVILTYTGSGERFLDNPPQSILIPPNKSKVEFDIDIEDIPDSDQLVNISARATDFTNSNSLSVTLVRDIKLKKSSMTLSSTPMVLGGSSVLVTVRIPEINKSNLPITVNLSYGDGESWLNNPPASVHIPPNKDEAEFEIDVKEDFAVSDQMLNISAKATGYSQYSNSLQVKLVPAVVKVNDGTLKLPPLPKLKIEAGKVLPYLNQETTSRSSTKLKGFWMTCKLRIHKYGVHESFTLPHQLYLWIPLGDNSPLRYYAHAKYLPASTDILKKYKESKTVHRANKYSPELTSMSKKEDAKIYWVDDKRVLSTDDFEKKVQFASLTGSGSSSIDAGLLGFSKVLPVANSKPIKTDKITLEGPSQLGCQRAYAQFVPEIFYQLGDDSGVLLSKDAIFKHINMEKTTTYVKDLFFDNTRMDHNMGQAYWETVKSFNKVNFSTLAAEIKQKNWLGHNDIYNITLDSYCILLFNYAVKDDSLGSYIVNADLPIIGKKEPVIDLYKPINNAPSGYRSGHSSPSIDLSQATTLTADKTTMRAGGSPITVTLAYIPGSPGVGKVKIKLSYEGIPATFIEGPKTVLIDVNDVARIKGIPATSFTIKTTADYKLSDHKIIKIIAETLDVNKKPKAIGSITFTLESNQYAIKEVADAGFEFPPIPKLKMENEGVTFDAFNKTTSLGKNSPDGFFVQCKLKATFTKIGGFNGGDTESKYLLTDRVDDRNPDRPIYFWIPLKKNNPLKYRITAYYKLGNSDLLYYGQTSSEQDSYTKITGSQTSTSKFDEQFREDYKDESNQQESTHTSSITRLDDITTGNSYTKGQGTSINNALNLPNPGVNFSNSFWTNSSLNKYKNHTNSTTNFDGTTVRNLLEKKIGYKLSNRYNQSITDNVSFNLSAQHSTNKSNIGPPIPHFVKVSAFIQPVLTYSLIDPSNGTLDNIEDYIDYESLNCLGSRKPTTVKEYIQCIMEPDQFNNDMNPDNPTLACYLRTFPQVDVMNKGLGSITKTIKNYFTEEYYSYHTKYLEDVQVDSYSVNITDFNAPYSAIFVHKKIPTDCGPVSNLSHQFTLPQRVGDDGISTFQWNAAPSATNFELEIKDDKNNVIVNYNNIEREYNSANKEPKPPIFYDIRKAYSISAPYYVARVRSRCGADADWSAYSDPITFTHSRAGCKVTGISATHISGNEYDIRWDAVPDAQGYKLEYANQDESFRAACKDLVSWSKDPCVIDVLTTNSYSHTSTKNFKIKVIPICPIGMGVPTVADFQLNKLVSCTAITNSLTVTFDKNNYPQFKWKLPSDGVASMIEIKDKNEEWGDSEAVTIGVVSKGRNGPFYKWKRTSSDSNNSIYVVRVSSQCILDADPSSSNWTDPSPEVEFTIPIMKESGVSVQSNNSLSSIGTSFAKKAPRNRRSNESKPSTLPELEPALHIAPNPVAEMLTFSITNLKKPATEIEIRLHGVLSGQVLHSERRTNIGAGEAQVINKNLSFGSYILVVILDGQKKLTQQFIKQ